MMSQMVGKKSAIKFLSCRLLQSLVLPWWHMYTCTNHSVLEGQNLRMEARQNKRIKTEDFQNKVICMASLNKAHTSALCLIPPRKAWETIQNYRCFNDRNFIRWEHLLLVDAYLLHAAAAVNQPFAAVNCHSVQDLLDPETVMHCQYSRSVSSLMQVAASYQFDIPLCSWSKERGWSEKRLSKGCRDRFWKTGDHWALWGDDPHSEVFSACFWWAQGSASRLRTCINAQRKINHESPEKYIGSMSSAGDCPALLKLERKFHHCICMIWIFLLQITLDEVSHFKHTQSCTIWLGSHSQELIDLQSSLQEAFPDFHELSRDPERNIMEFSPHLSLGQWKHSNVQTSLQVRYWPSLASAKCCS